MRGFLLGLSSGAVCATYCSPVLVPYLLGEGRGVLQNFLLLIQFLLGRFLGYISLALFACGIRAVLPQDMTQRNLIIGSSYLILSVLLIFYSFFRPGRTCTSAGDQGIKNRLRDFSLPLFPLTLGFATGLNLCPPLLLAIATAAEQANLLQRVLFFLTFFLGTSLFLIPAPLLGMWRRFPPLHVVGKMAAGLIGAYYLYMGANILAGGLYR